MTLKERIEVLSNYHQYIAEQGFPPNDFEKGYLEGLRSAMENSKPTKETVTGPFNKNPLVNECEEKTNPYNVSDWPYNPNTVTYTTSDVEFETTCTLDKLADESTTCPCGVNPSCLCKKAEAEKAIEYLYKCGITGNIFTVYKDGSASYYENALDREFRLTATEPNKK